MSIALFQAIFSIIIIDLVLSGDNAVVIGMAARRLAPDQRRRAILFGAGGAIGLRVLFTALAAIFLQVPLLQAIGGVLLIWIAYRLLRDEHKEQEVRAGANLFEAVRTIILADVVMSLDNILAVGGAAHGDLILLLFGLAVSMPIILFGSNIVALLMNRLPWLAYIGAAILLYTAGEMILRDAIVGRFLPDDRWLTWSMIIALIIAVIGVAMWRNQTSDATAVATRQADQARANTRRSINGQASLSERAKESGEARW